MSKTEEQARDIRKFLVDNFDFHTQRDIDLLIKFANSQQLNLDVKHQDKDFIIGELTKKIQQLTKECDEFEESSRFQYNHVLQVREQLQAVTKELDKLKEFATLQRESINQANILIEDASNIMKEDAIKLQESKQEVERLKEIMSFVYGNYNDKRAYIRLCEGLGIKYTPLNSIK